VTGTGVEAETALADATSSADALNTELDDTRRPLLEPGPPLGTLGPKLPQGLTRPRPAGVQ